LKPVVRLPAIRFAIDTGILLLCAPGLLPASCTFFNRKYDA